MHKIKFEKGLALNAIVTSCVDKVEGGISDNFVKIVDRQDSEGMSEVLFEVNGVELDFGLFVNKLVSNYEAYLKEEAKQIVSKEIGLEEIRDKIDSEIMEMMSKLNTIQEDLNRICAATEDKVSLLVDEIM